MYRVFLDIITSQLKFIYFTTVIYIDFNCGLYTPHLWSE